LVSLETNIIGYWVLDVFAWYCSNPSPMSSDPREFETGTYTQATNQPNNGIKALQDDLTTTAA